MVGRLRDVFESDDALNIFSGKYRGLGEIYGDSDVGRQIHYWPTRGRNDIWAFLRHKCIFLNTFRGVNLNGIEIAWHRYYTF